jgi:hypothetical protein
MFKVSAYAETDTWNNGSGTLATLMQAQESFEPATYTSAEHGYSFSHPPDFLRRANEGFDYYARFPSRSASVIVKVHPDQGYKNVLDYGTASGGGDWEIISRGLVYPKRPNPSYLIEFRSASSKRWAVLITLGGGNAVWLYVGADEDDWPEIEPIANDIFLRFAMGQDGKSELTTVQAAVDALMVNKGLGKLAAVATAKNDWTTCPTEGPLFAEGYLQVETTIWDYTWDATGRVNQGGRHSGADVGCE